MEMPEACPGCRAPISGAERFCPHCGTPLDRLASDPTLEAPTTPRDSARGSRPPSTPAGSGTGRERFSPGQVVADRYRIVGLLGRGGMGEVYRADDLTLEQPVALKFLPLTFASDPDRLVRFRNEVRMARQVTHPNVCRVHDIGTTGDLQYLSMEYVDGEDLASLLRRIGHLPRDKGIEIARQLCAGLAAAHAKGVLHRDLKPANVMIDGEGKVRITDFGLASAVSELDRAEIRSGTPAYMAPEQRDGREVTEKSDLFALGLVLYETLTGRRPFEGDSSASRGSGAATTTRPTPPSTVVPDLDPALERVILRCLEADPSRRPASALAIAAALPGGDPLAAAGSAEATSPAHAWGFLLVFVIGLLGFAWLAGPHADLTRFQLGKTPAMLEGRAAELIRSFGYAETPADRASGLMYDRSLLADRLSRIQETGVWDDIEDVRPPLVHYWYRQSPRHLDPVDPDGIVSPTDPPQRISGMVQIRLDGEGRLIRLEAVPPQVTAVPDSAPRAAVDWNSLFTAAGLDTASIEPVAPAWIPDSYADSLQTWRGRFAGGRGDSLWIDTASFRGLPVHFQIRAPWTRPDRVAGQRRPFDRRLRWAEIGQLLIMLAAIFGGLFVTVRNLQLGRGDWRGATRIAVVVLICSIGVWILTANHSASASALFNNFVESIGRSLFLAILLWLLYVALEPYVRRRWPHRIVSWSRLVTGRVRDPIVGRDFLIGAILGLVLGWLQLLHLLVPKWLDWSGGIPLWLFDPDNLLGAHRQVATLLRLLPMALLNALVIFFIPILLLRIVRKQWIALGLLFLLLAAIIGTRSGDFPMGPITGVLT
ncbi:MAG: protein kinase, partial [Candidatus Eisenbacteria bacterium]|nr:protein kinase [Candidatus Latescibacterota bacterium]MBD3302558.1 protein kinase [Candidatus Eisenbacteria bacterium]